eukprot:CAMPEP_0172729790 /NCGR_PEP_ID=MMETSP1074-20121228/95891_1 /TAXON_ID=2916 /ORGANISM="Ceratium fusus, Strain PA161109" /LENGTH=295 /DNA_ID=CAMNT_0013557351 /DNA_START=287 /DNA_END=1175 /DNA_ORIENTATION=-
MVTCIDTATAVAAAAAAVQANTPNVQQRIPFRKDSLPVTPQSTVSNQRTQFQQRLEETISDRCTQLLQRLEVLEQRFDYEEGVVRPIIWRRLEAFEQCLANEASKNHEGGNTVHIAKSWPEEPRRKEPRPSAATEPTDDFRSLQCSVSILQDTCVSHSEALDRSLADLSGLKEEVKCSIAEDIREKVFNVAQRVGSELWSERRERIQGQQLLQDTLQSQQELLTQLAAFVDAHLGHDRLQLRDFRMVLKPTGTHRSKDTGQQQVQPKPRGSLAACLQTQPATYPLLQDTNDMPPL